jgi:hypothetical protein
VHFAVRLRHREHDLPCMRVQAREAYVVPGRLPDVCGSAPQCVPALQQYSRAANSVSVVSS